MSFQYFVIGKGSIGHRHASNLSFLGARVTHYGWRNLNMDHLLDEITACRGDAGVIIATSTNIRRQLITQCSEVGAALYIEKPVAHKTIDVQKIFDLPNTTLERSVAGFMMRYHPMVRKLLDTPVKNIFRASFEIGHDVTKWRQNWTFADSYAADPDGGGVLLDLCHEIDLACLLCGSAPLSSVNSIEDPNFAGVDIATILDFASTDGRNIRVAMDYLAPALIRRGHIVGLEQQVEYDIANANLTRVTKDERVTQNLGKERNAMFLDLMSDFMALAEGRETINPHIPRLDRVKNVCHLIAEAWEMRQFTGQLKANLT